MNKKVINLLFFIIVLFFIFNNIPKALQINFIGGILQTKLVFYPIFIGLIYTLYYQYKYKNVLVNLDKFLKFIVIYFSVMLISLVIGLYSYPYYDLVLNGPVTQIEKLPKVINILNNFGISVDEKVLTIIWMIQGRIKGALLEGLYTFGGAYMIYCWYHNNWRIAFDILIKAVLSSLVIIFGYCFIELFYLGGNETAKNILTIITPYFHYIEINYGWWPRILQPGAIRSIFAEPSFFSIWASFALPFVWYKLINSNILKSKIVFIIITIIFTVLIFLTNSRTGVALLCGEFVCLLIYALWVHNKFIVRKFIAVSICTIFAFGLSNYFINNFMTGKEIRAEDYFKNNLTNIASVKARSNGARYSTIYANVMIGLDNPILGVGKGLVSAYMPDYFPDFAENNLEVQMWIRYQEEYGILKMSIPILCAYSVVFAESGIVGLLCYLFPAVFLIYNILKILYRNKERLEFAILLIALLGILASGFSNTLNVTYCYWILLGLGYAMCFGKENDVKDNGDTGSRQEH